MDIPDDQWNALVKQAQGLLDFVRSIEVAPPPAVTPPPVVTPPGASSYPSSLAWRTEDEEVAWINSLGFSCSVADLRASYAKFVPKAKPPTTRVLWDTETDDLRNYVILTRRTGYAGFAQQAQLERDWQVNTYSRVGSGPTSIEPEHVYLMGLCMWVKDHPADTAAKDAVQRILGFVHANLPTTYIETRVIARMLQCLCYYKECFGGSAVDADIAALVKVVRSAPVVQGFVSFPKYYVGELETVDGQVAGTDLRVLFPKNAAFKSPAGGALIADATHFNLKTFPGAASFQDVILMHALRVAARVLDDPTLATIALAQAAAWLQVTGYPWLDPAGKASNVVIGYNVVTSAPELSMFKYNAGSSTPLYATQFAAYCPDPALARTLQQQALLRQYGQLTKIAASELGGKPRYFPWETWESGWLLTQK